MEFSAFTLGIAGTIVLIFVIYKTVETIIFWKHVNKIPGPKALIPILGNVLEFQGSQERIFEVLENYSNTYYPVYKLTAGNNALVFLRAPQDAEVVLSGMKNIQKNEFYLALHMWLDTGLLTSTDEKWHLRRRILTPAFHFNILQQFTLTFIEKSEKLVHELEGLLDKELDIVPLITKYTFYIICETAMGTNVEDVETEEYRSAVYKMGGFLVHRVVRPWFYNPILYLASKNFYKAISTSRFLHKYSRNIIQARKKTFSVDNMPVDTNHVYKGKQRLVMLDMLLHAQHQNNDIDDDGIREEVDTFMFEGHDTTSCCLTFTFMLLACNREIQDKVVDEINELLPNKDCKLTFDILNNMKYLERVIKESLRLYPSVPQFGRHLTETIEIPSGYILPVGANVFIRAYDMHRDPKIYPNPEKFDPDRFLPEQSKERHPYAYLPFSAGPRNCIGQKFALLEMKAVLSSVLRNYEALPIDTPKTITLVADLVLHTKGGVRMLFRRRNTCEP